MKRKDAETIRAEITEKSLALFREKGYNNVGVIEISEACGISKPTFYKYATSKEDLLASFFQPLTCVEVIDAAEIPDEKLWDTMNERFDKLIRYCTSLGCDLLTELFISNVNQYRGTFNEVDGYSDNLLIILDRLKDLGIITNPSSSRALMHTLIGTLIGTLMGTAAYWCLTNGTADESKLVRNALHNILMVDEEKLHALTVQ